MDKATADRLTPHRIIRDVIVDSFDISLSSASTDAETVIVCLRDHGYEVKHITELTTPPKSHIMQVAKLATMLPTSEEADNAASEVISQFEKGAGKPLPIPEAPSKPAEPLHEAVHLYKCSLCGGSGPVNEYHSCKFVNPTLPTDRLLDAAKAVLEWYNHHEPVDGDAVMDIMCEAIHAIEKEPKGPSNENT